MQEYTDALLDEKFKNDRQRIANHEDHMKEQDGEIKDIRELTTKIAALVEQNNESVKRHEKRISVLENKPNKYMDYAASAAISAIVAFIMGILLK